MCGNHQHHQPAVKLQAFNRNSEIPHKALPHHSFTNAIPTASKAELSIDRKQNRWDWEFYNRRGNSSDCGADTQVDSLPQDLNIQDNSQQSALHQGNKIILYIFKGFVL